MCSNLKKRRAFTLVELLVVIGIIALLISVLLPALGKARESASKVKCASNQRQVGIAYQQYALDNKNYVPWRAVQGPTGRDGVARWVPYATFGPDSGYVDATQASVGVALLLKPPMGVGRAYLQSNDVFFCPSDDIRRPYRDRNHGWGPSYVPVYGDAGRGYSMSYWGWYYPRESYNKSTGLVEYRPAPELVNEKYNLKGPSNRTLMTDQGVWTRPGLATSDPDYVASMQYPFFHKKGWNVLYLDGHVKWIAYDAINAFGLPAPQGQGRSSYSAMIYGYNKAG